MPLSAFVTAGEFATAMDRLGPWDRSRRVAVAVSGGPDSMALALLAQHWGDPAALIVDHRLRPESAAEAETARAQLVARGIPATVLALHGLAPGPGIAKRAREARYAALAAACRERGLVDLLLGHHAGDQAETVLLRRRAASGPAGLAGMAALAEADDVRLVRPLLAFAPERLAAVVAASGLIAANDPTNTDMRTTRARLRHEIGRDRDALAAEAAGQGRARRAAEQALAAELAGRVALYPEGFALVTPGPISAGALAAVVRTISGRRYPVPGLGALAAALRPATIGGVRILPAGRLGPGWLVVREAAAMAGSAPAAAGTVWDHRFRVVRAPVWCEINALAHDAALMRTISWWPSVVLRSLPAFRYDGVLSTVPHLNYSVGDSASHGSVVHSAALPAAGAPFMTC